MGPGLLHEVSSVQVNRESQYSAGNLGSSEAWGGRYDRQGQATVKPAD